MATRKNVLGDLNDREVMVIQLRASGAKIREIVEITGSTEQAIFKVIKVIYRKTSIPRVPYPRVPYTKVMAAWAQWAWDHGLEAPVAPDTPETAAVPEPKVRKGRIRLGRIARSRLS